MYFFHVNLLVVTNRTDTKFVAIPIGCKQ